MPHPLVFRGSDALAQHILNFHPFPDLAELIAVQGTDCCRRSNGIVSILLQFCSTAQLAQFTQMMGMEKTEVQAVAVPAAKPLGHHLEMLGVVG